MRIRNPNYVPKIDKNAAHVKFRDLVLGVVSRAGSASEFLTFGEFREALKVTDSELPDGSLAQIFQDANIETAD